MDRRTWAPFQSQTVKDICNHMTEDEKNASASYASKFGILNAFFFAIPVSFGLTLFRPWILGPLGLAIFAWLSIGIYLFIQMRKKGKELLCSTQWAKSKGITPDKL